MTTIGSLFTGAAALCHLAVAPLLGGRVVWHSEIDPAACRVLDHRAPGMPNLGNIAAVDWPTVPRVDVLVGGFPCQDISNAGQRAGIEGARSGLWSYFTDAIRVLRPRLVVVENVAALVVRGLDRVLADLAALGLDAEWTTVRASSVGAPHRRERLVLVAADPGRYPWTQDVQDGPAARGSRGTAAVADDLGRSGAGGAQHGRTGPADRDQPALLPTPRATDGTKGGPNQRGSSGDLMLPSAVASLLPTPTAVRYGNNQSPSPGASVRPSLDTLAATLLPTPTAMDAEGARCATANRRDPKPTTSTTGHTLSDVAWVHPAEQAIDWGVYAAAVARWAGILGRPAPHPTITGQRGGRRLNPQLCEWMMGWPAGWVTDVPGVSPNEALRLCGNGVVPQQIQAGARYLLSLLYQTGVAV